MVVDAICNLLFESNQDIYDENKFSVDGELIDSPPPSDEVWLLNQSAKTEEKRCMPNAASMKNINVSATSPDIAVVSVVVFSVDFSSHVEIL